MRNRLPKSDVYMNLNRGTTFSPIALSTFGDATKKLIISFWDALPKVAKANKATEPFLKGNRLSTILLLVLISLNQLLIILQTSFTFFTKQAILTRRSSVLSLPLQLVFPGKAKG